MTFNKNTTYILDGAMGTELQRRGYETTLPLWSARALFNAPDVVQDIHKKYILAGADIITTNTFRTQYRTLEKAGLSNQTQRINQLATQLAVQARKEADVDRPVFIAGSLTTLEDCYEVNLVPDDKTLVREHTEQASILAATPIDFFLLETFGTQREVLAAARAAHATSKPIAISFIINEVGDLLSGESLAETITLLEAETNPIAYLVNCISEANSRVAIEKLASLTDKSFGAYVNGDGEAHHDQGWKFNPNQASHLQSYVNTCNHWVSMGANIIGGCCGTNPEYTRAYSTIRS